MTLEGEFAWMKGDSEATGCLDDGSVTEVALEGAKLDGSGNDVKNLDGE